MSSGSILSDREMLMEEIISLRRERKDLMESLTPKISFWRNQIPGAAISESIRSFHKMDSSFQSYSQQQQQVCLPSAVTDDFNILEDMVDLGQRMLSLSHSLSTCHAAISLYKADELVSTASKLHKISLDFYNSTEAAMDEEAAEEERRKQSMEERDSMMAIWNKEGEGTAEELNEDMMMKKQIMCDDELMHFLQLSRDVQGIPHDYQNELAMLFTVADEVEYEKVLGLEEYDRMRESERQREKSKPRRQREKSKQQIVLRKEHATKQETKSLAEQLKEGMDDELGFFADYRRVWGYSSGSKAGRCGGFEDKTTVSPLQFTHCTRSNHPPRAAVVESTLQIYSFKVVGLTEQQRWPLYVYGVVAARDSVDRNRNLLFSRSRIMHQVLTEDDPYLRLTGPSRAILAVDYVDFEVELKVRDGDDERTDTQLVCAVNRYDGDCYEEVDNNGEHRPLPFHNPFCRAELRFERLPKTVQATILSVRFIGEEFPLKFGGQVVCVIAGAREKVVLFRSIEKKSEEDEVDLGGYVPLSRNVVSVELEGGLDVVVEAYEGSDSTSGHCYFCTDCSNISQGSCSVGGSEVEITVAWSLLLRDKMDMLIEGYATQV